MTDHLCPCGRPAPTTTICEHCLTRLHRDLDALPDAISELLTQLSRQARTGSGGMTSRSAERPLAFDLAASDTLDLLRSVLVGWTRDIVETARAKARATAPDAPQSHATAELVPEYPPDTLRGMVRFLRYRDWSGHPAADEFADELHWSLTQVRVCIDAAPDRRYLGPCGSILDDNGEARECAGDVYQVDTKPPQCRACKATHHTDERMAWIAEMAQDQLVTATVAAGALSAWGEHIKPELIWKWASRGRLLVKGHDQAGRPVYSFADCRALAVESLKRRPRHAEKAG